MQRWDVIVVGGGPAGSRAAEVVAREGFSTLILDQKTTIGEPNHCGEGVSEDCLAEVGALPPQAWIRSEVIGSLLHFPNNSSVMFPRRGYSIDRPVFDRFLIERAMNRGAEVETGHRVLSIRDLGDVWQVQSRKRSFLGRFLVGAGGARCPVAHGLGQRIPIITACEHKLPPDEVPDDLRDDWLHFFHNERFLGGYAWVFNRGDEVAVGAGGINGAARYLDELCRELGIDPDTRRVTEGGAIPFLDQPLRISFRRAILCGDAGGFIYPLTKGGVHGAVWSGRLAGEALVRALADDPNETGFLGYERSVAEHPCRIPAHLRVSHAFLKFDNQVMNTMGRVMDGKIFSASPVLRCSLEFLRRPTPKTLWTLRVGLAVQRSYAANEKFAW